MGRTALAVAANLVATLAGSALLASALVAVAVAGGRLPQLAVGVVSLLAAAAVAAESRVAPPGSRWMVPREWARLGTTGYAAAFGLALGAGVVTVVPSAALYALLTAALAAPKWWEPYVLLVLFGFTRAVVVLLLTARSARHGTHPIESMPWVSLVSGHAATAEALVAAALGAEVLRSL